MNANRLIRKVSEIKRMTQPIEMESIDYDYLQSLFLQIETTNLHNQQVVPNQ